LLVSLLKDLVQKLRVQHVLHFGETAQTHSGASDDILNPWNPADGTEPTHALDHRVHEPKEKQGQVMGILQLTVGMIEGRMNLLRLGNPLEDI